MRQPLRHIPLLTLAIAIVVALTAPAAQGASKGIWISSSEIAALPTSGPAWDSLKAAADGSLGAASVADQDSVHDVRTLAVALVWARTGDVAYRAKAAQGVLAAIGTEAGGRTLALARNLVGYAIAADLIDLSSYDPAGNQRFRAWLSSVRYASLDGSSLIMTHDRRPNNWGTNAGAARIAADLYLGDMGDLARAATVFRGWLGDRAAYKGFDWGDMTWQADPANPVGINRKGATIQGHLVDGVLPDDLRRSGGFIWPAPKENYVWGALGPALVQAELLRRGGYGDVYSWSDAALRRAMDWLHNVNQFPATGDDGYAPWIANAALGTSYPAPSRTSGKAMGWTDWTHGAAGGGAPPPVPAPVSTSEPEPTPEPLPATPPTEPALEPSPPPPPAAVPTPPPASTTPTFTASADAQVDSSRTTTNYGKVSSLAARAGDGRTKPTLRTYLSFTVTGLTKAPSSAVLRLYVTDSSDTGGMLSVTSGTWQESTITWATAPPPSRTVGVLPAAKSGKWVEIDVTSAVRANGTVGFVIATWSMNTVAYASRETGNAATLVVKP